MRGLIDRFRGRDKSTMRSGEVPRRANPYKEAPPPREMMRAPESRDSQWDFKAGETAVTDLRDGNATEFRVKAAEEQSREFWAGVSATLATEVAHAGKILIMQLSQAYTEVEHVLKALRASDVRVDVRPAANMITKAFSTVH